MIGRMQAQSGFVENSAQIIEAGAPVLGWISRFMFNMAPISVIRCALIWAIRWLLRQDGVQCAALDGRSALGGGDLFLHHFRNTVGVLIAWDRTPGILKTLLPTTLTFTSIPFFMLGILLIHVFAFWLRWSPLRVYGRGLTQGFNLAFMSSVAYHAILPIMAIVVTSMGLWAIGMRGMMITTAGEDYMILAQAKGLQPSRIFWLYGVRNSILPQVTALALTLGTIVGGSLLVEYIFAYPGVGYLLYQGIVTSDYTLIQGIVFMLIFVTATAVLILDLIYPLIDPRIASFQRG